jgi:ribosome-associated toxin RatA of RatAB toxin-antitoxin module
MKHIKRSVLLWYSPHEMYSLVTAVADYPTFLPWCERAEILQQHDNGVTAKLHLAYAGARYAFTTRNHNVVDQQVRMELVDGPFSQLDGLWSFVPLNAPGSDSPTSACKVEFDLRYAFSSRALELVVSPVFDRIANTFVDAFVKRAEQAYGSR